MKNPATSHLVLTLVFCAGLARAGAAGQPAGTPLYVADWPATHARCRPVPLASVKAEGFLGRRIQNNIGSLLEGLKGDLVRRFEARAAGQEPPPETNRLAADSDVFKWLEGAAYMFALTGHADVGREMERMAGLIIACQKEDGYLNTQVPPQVRFDTRVDHDLYSAGHFFEAAAAHYRATGKRDILDAARCWADYLIAEYNKGNPYYQIVARREHSEYELGLLRLYRATGEKKYLDFSIALTRLIPTGTHLIEDRHAVRTNYLLAAYADLFLETGQDEFRRDLPSLWEEVVNTRSYVTGGVSVHERYSREPHYLPQITEHPRRDISETCTSIALMMYAWRLHSMRPESPIFDQIETILYNHYLGALSLDNLATFYYNPLRLVKDYPDKTDHDGPLYHRLRLPALHSTSCCVPNEWHFFGALSEYLFSYDEDGVYVNLYTSSRIRHRLPNGAEANFTVETGYPHEGRIRLRMEMRNPRGTRCGCGSRAGAQPLA